LEGELSRMLYLDECVNGYEEVSFHFELNRKPDHIVCLIDTHEKSANWYNSDDGLWNRLLQKQSASSVEA